MVGKSGGIIGTPKSKPKAKALIKSEPKVVAVAIASIEGQGVCHIFGVCTLDNGAVVHQAFDDILMAAALEQDGYKSDRRLLGEKAPHTTAMAIATLATRDAEHRGLRPMLDATAPPLPDPSKVVVPFPS